MTISTNDVTGVGTVMPLVRDLTEDVNMRRALPSSHARMIGPFVLLDRIGPAVFQASQGFDMGPHPHIGLVTVTYLFDGEIIHRDSLGNVQAIRPGEVNWLTAGRGIVHSERTAPEPRASGSNLFGIQAWIALPREQEDVAADLTHYGASEVPRTCARGVEFTLLAGASDGLTSPVRTLSDMVYAEIILTSGARYQVKPEHIERAIYIVAGEIEIVGRPGTFGEAELILLKPGVEIVLKAPRSTQRA